MRDISLIVFFLFFYFFMITLDYYINYQEQGRGEDTDKSGPPIGVGLPPVVHII